MPGPPRGAFITNDNDITRLDLATDDAFHGSFLALKNTSRSGEFQNALIHASSLNDAAIERNIAKQDGQTTILTIGMFLVTDAAFGAVLVQFLISAGLRESLNGTNTTGSSLVEHLNSFGWRPHDVVSINCFTKGRSMNRCAVAMNKTGTVQLGQNAEDTTRTVAILNMIFLRHRRQLADVRHDPRKAVDVCHGEVHFTLLRDGQKMQDRVGGTAHGDIQRHGILESLEGSDITRQDAFVFILVIALAHFNGLASSFKEQLLAIGMGGNNRTIARRAKPRDSARQFIELAVNMPEQEPQVGQANSSTF